MNANAGQMMASAQAVAEVFGITYWVPHQDDVPGDVSIFQGFSRGILEAADLFEIVARWPFDVRELFADRDHVLHARLGGFARTRVFPVRISSFAEMVPRNNSPFNVVVSVESVVDQVSDVLARSGRHWLHASTTRHPNSICVDDVDDQAFLDFFRDVARAHANHPVYPAMFREFLAEPVRAWPTLTADCPGYSHNLTHPNEVALDSMRISLRGLEPMGPHAPGLYFSGSVRSARTVVGIRERLTTRFQVAHHANDLTLAIDSVGWGVSRADIRQRVVDAGASRSEAILVDAVVNRSGFASETRVGRSALGDFAQAVLRMRSVELRAMSSALVLHSGLRLTPVLRLNPGLNELRPRLIDIGNCARGDGPHRDFKLNKLGRRLSENMAEIVDRRVISTIRGAANRIGEIAMVADLPLEWLSIDGLPLAIKHDVSRVPCNPGNLMFAQCASNEIAFVSKDSFDEILVVRSFRNGDPIAGHLEAALSRPIGRRNGPSPSIKFVDVSTQAEFVEAVSAFSGSILIFDGHGSRDATTGVGTIVVGGQPLDVWGLRHELTLPPIVLLSACDTYPIDGSHGSTAVGMLALGARTVLGTLLPIHSIRSCAFLSRLVYRLAAFLPIAMKVYPNGVSWRLIMSGMLRMVYASEIAYAFAASVSMDPARRGAILYQANTDINYRNPRWFDLLQKRLATEAHVPVAKVKAFCDRYAWITDSLKYVQLGRPELIHVVEATPAEVWANVDPGGEAPDLFR